MLMGGDVRSDWEIECFHSMSCYVLTMNNCGKLQEGSNEGVDWIIPKFQAIKYTSFSFTIDKIIQGCVGMVDGFKISDVVLTSISRGYADDMVMNTIIDVLSYITRGGCNLQGENRILLYLTF